MRAVYELVDAQARKKTDLRAFEKEIKKQYLMYVVQKSK